MKSTNRCHGLENSQIRNDGGYRVVVVIINIEGSVVEQKELEDDSREEESDSNMVQMQALDTVRHLEFFLGM